VIRDTFYTHFVNVSAPLALVDYELDHHAGGEGQVGCRARVAQTDGDESNEIKTEALGNGPINAFVMALKQAGLKRFTVTDYRSHAIRGGSDSDSAAYIQVRGLGENAPLVWGCGVDPSIEMAGLKALVSACNLLD
jgi:2-isopropylmalate synthase